MMVFRYKFVRRMGPGPVGRWSKELAAIASLYDGGLEANRSTGPRSPLPLAQLGIAALGKAFTSFRNCGVHS